MNAKWCGPAFAAILFLLICFHAGAQESFGEDFSSGEDGTEDSASGGLSAFFNNAPLSIGGKATIYAMGILGGDAPSSYFDADKLDDTVYVSPQLFLDIGYAGKRTEFIGSLKFDVQTIKEYPQDILNELTMRLYAGDFVIEGGKMKLVWGKGDNLHVIDNFNANDFTLFIIPEYLDRRLAEPMFHVAWNSPFGLRAEAVYAPVMTADRFAPEGIWAPSRYMAVYGMVQQVAAVQSAAALAANNPVALEAVAARAESIMPPTTSFDYGQAGLRLTYTIGMFDLGVSYYYGHYKQPTVNLSGYLAALGSFDPVTNPNPLVLDSAWPSVHYDRLQVFGLEAAAALGPFNLRSELAYYLSDDRAGSDPWTKNNSIDWVAGLDVDIPLHNLNLNAQTIGKYIVRNDKIGSGGYPAKFDADYKPNGTYVTNQLALVLRDTFLREKLALSCQLVIGIGIQDILVKPVAAYTVFDGLTFELSGMYIASGDNGDFHDYQDNSYIQLMMSYTF